MAGSSLKLRVLIALLSCACWAGSIAVHAKPRTPKPKRPEVQKMDFKNNIMPGFWTRHLIVRTTERIRDGEQKGSGSHSTQFEQTAEWTQCNIDDPDPGSVVLYQLMVDHPVRVTGHFRDGKKIKPPETGGLDLEKGSTRLISTNRTLKSSPGQTPLVDQPERSILQALLSAMQSLPQEAVTAGHTWRKNVSGEHFEGRQELEFVDILKEKKDTLARVTLYVTGRFTGLTGRKYTFDRLQAILYWSRIDQCLRGIEAQAVYASASGQTRYSVKINAALQKSGLLGDAQQEEVKQQIGAINEALKEVTDGHDRDAMRLAAAFRKTWPGSMWTPAMDEIAKQVEARSRAELRLSEKQLLEVLTRAFLRHEAALAGEDEEVIAGVQRLLSNLPITRPQVKRLLKSRDEKIRSMGVFGMAMSHRPAALREIYDTFADKSAQVRTVAMIALALRGDPATDPLALLDGMKDTSAGVRARACDAIAACILRENISVADLVDRLDELIVHDESDLVRRSAIRALAAIGAPPDAARLKKALTHELHKSNRAELERAIAHLEASGG